jgi:C4-type Zn-finger protein
MGFNNTGHFMDGEYCVFWEDMVINKSEGIKSLRYLQDYEESEIDETDRVVRTQIKVHKSFFEPITTKIEIPESCFEDVAPAQVSEIEIPVQTEVKLTPKTKFKIEAVHGVLDMVKKVLKREDTWEKKDG